MRSHAVRSAIQLVGAVVLVVLGILGILATHAHFVPCEISQSTPECLDAMDGMQPFYGSIQIFWLIAAAISIAAAVLAIGSAARWLAIGAVGIVLVMNQITEYALWLAFYGGHWDVPPGTGYTQSSAFILAGVLLAMSAAMGFAHVGATRADASRAETALVG